MGEFLLIMTDVANAILGGEISKSPLNFISLCNLKQDFTFGDIYNHALFYRILIQTLK